MKQQHGFAHTFLIIGLIVALLGALGFIFWQNFVSDGKSTDENEIAQVADSDDSKESVGYVPTIPEGWNRVENDENDLSYATPSSWNEKVAVTVYAKDDFILIGDSGAKAFVKYSDEGKSWRHYLQTTEDSSPQLNNNNTINEVVEIDSKVENKWNSYYYKSLPHTGYFPIRYNVLTVKNDKIYEFALPLVESKYGNDYDERQKTEISAKITEMEGYISPFVKSLKFS